MHTKIVFSAVCNGAAPLKTLASVIQMACRIIVHSSHFRLREIHRRNALELLNAYQRKGSWCWHLIWKKENFPGYFLVIFDTLEKLKQIQITKITDLNKIATCDLIAKPDASAECVTQSRTCRKRRQIVRLLIELHLVSCLHWTTFGAYQVPVRNRSIRKSLFNKFMIQSNTKYRKTLSCLVRGVAVSRNSFERVFGKSRFTC